MSTPTMLPDVSHQSAHWAGGQAQQTNYWCFAAADAIVQTGFGANVSQVSIAHQSLMAAGEANTNHANAPHATDYYYGVQEIWALNSLPDTSWTNVGTHVTADPTLYGYLRTSYGLPQFTGRTVTSGAALTTDQIIACLDADGLVVTANNIHFKVIYGYRRVSGAVSFHVYNPFGSGGDSWIPAATVTGDMITTFRVTA